MVNTLTKTQREILTMLRKHPNSTTRDMEALLPHMTYSQVHVNISILKTAGHVKATGTRVFTRKNGFTYPVPTYTAKYTRKASEREEPVVQLEEAPVITTVIPHVDEKLQLAYERLAFLHTETMAELAAEKKAHLCNSWWCRLKRWFV